MIPKVEHQHKKHKSNSKNQRSKNSEILESKNPKSRHLLIQWPWRENPNSIFWEALGLSGRLWEALGSSGKLSMRLWGSLASSGRLSRRLWGSMGSSGKLSRRRWSSLGGSALGLEAAWEAKKLIFYYKTRCFWKKRPFRCRPAKIGVTKYLKTHGFSAGAQPQQSRYTHPGVSYTRCQEPYNESTAWVTIWKSNNPLL